MLKPIKRTTKPFIAQDRARRKAFDVHYHGRFLERIWVTPAFVDVDRVRKWLLRTGGDDRNKSYPRNIIVTEMSYQKFLPS